MGKKHVYQNCMDRFNAHHTIITIHFWARFF
jgi:hypothetical protein